MNSCRFILGLMSIAFGLLTGCLEPDAYISTSAGTAPDPTSDPTPGTGSGDNSGGNQAPCSTPQKSSGWNCYEEFKIEFEKLSAAGSVTLRNNILAVLDTQKNHHADHVVTIASDYSMGATITEFDGKYEEDLVDYFKNLAKEKVVVANKSSVTDFSNDFTDDLIKSVGVIFVVASGNSGDGSFPKDSDKPQGTLAVESGLVIIASGANVERTARHSHATPCAGFGRWCVLAPYQVKHHDAGHPAIPDEIYRGTSFAAPQVSAAAANLSQMWPHLSNRQIVSIILTSATDIGDKGVDEDTGRGLLSYERMFSPAGELKDPLGNGMTPGEIFLPGLNGVLQTDVHDFYRRNFHLVTSQGRVAILNDSVSSGQAMPPEKIWFSYDNKIRNNSAFAVSWGSGGRSTGSHAWFFISIGGEWGACTEIYLGICASLKETEHFFHGWGTNSLAVGNTKYRNLGLHKVIEIMSGAKLKFALDLSCGRAIDMHVIKNLRGCRASPSLKFKRQNSSSSFSLGAELNKFSGRLTFAGKPHSIGDTSFGLKAGWEFRF